MPRSRISPDNSSSQTAWALLHRQSLSDGPEAPQWIEILPGSDLEMLKKAYLLDTVLYGEAKRAE